MLVRSGLQVQTSHLLQQLADLLPVLSLAVIEDVVPPPAERDHLPQTLVFCLQVFLWKTFFIYFQCVTSLSLLLL